MDSGRGRRSNPRAALRRRASPPGTAPPATPTPGSEAERAAPAGSPVDTASSRILQAVQDVATSPGGPRGSRTAAGIQGMSLGVKFTLVISGVAAFLMITTGIVHYAQNRKFLDSEIDNRGRDLVLFAGELVENYRIEIKRVRDEWDKKFGHLSERENREEYKKAQEIKAQDEDSLRLRYQEYLQELVYIQMPGGGKPAQSATVMNIFVASREEGRGWTPKLYVKDVKTLEGQYVPTFREDMDHKTYQLPKGKGLHKGAATSDNIEVRAFYRELEAEGDPWRVYVFLSAEQIRSTKTQLMLITLILTLLAILVGILISFILASRVTKPVRRLLDDIAIVSSGDLHHRTIAHSKDEIGLLAHSFDAMTQNLQIAHNQELENKAREHELSIATEIQSNLLPKKIPQYPGYDIDAFWKPSKEVGGDYYDFIQIDENNVGIVVADVSGKGVPGSLVMTMARMLLRIEAERNRENPSARETFINTNRILAKDIKRGMFVTALYAILNIKTGVLQVASAGHNPMVIWRAQMNKVSLVNPHGIALGFDKGPIFERTIKEEKIQLNPGDRIVLYTDGVPEAMSPDHQEFGDERFHRIVHDHSSKASNHFINFIVQALEEWRAGAQQSDDITIMTLRRV